MTVYSAIDNQLNAALMLLRQQQVDYLQRAGVV
jgi:hypothetical protein